MPEKTNDKTIFSLLSNKSIKKTLEQRYSSSFGLKRNEQAEPLQSFRALFS
jgi:hypothetical protein